MSPDDDKPFACNAPGCGMRFTNEDHLTVHKRKHEMSLSLNSGCASTKASVVSGLFVADQTPTPTKFLRGCEELGLFHELNKNPFEEAFKKATDGFHSSHDLHLLAGPTLDTPQALDTPGTAAMLHYLQKVTNLPPLPGPTLDTPTHILDTPTPALLRPIQRTVSEEIPELSADNMISIPMTEVATPVPPVVPEPVTVVSGADVPVKIEPETTASQVVPASPPTMVMETPSPITEVELSTHDVISQSNAAPSLPVATLSPSILKGGQMATVQMLIQLPNGQTIPVAIPATIPEPVKSSTDVETSNIRGGAGTSLNSSALTKQRLKAALSQNVQQNILNSNMMVMSEAVDRVTSMSSPESLPDRIPTIVASPREYSLSPTPSVMPDSSTIPSKRSKLGEDDPDERRRKFLERNRAAAARCRYKRKAWINGLERKSDDMISLNAKLQNEITVLRTEVAQLKSLLLAHKNCPVTVQQQQQGQLNLVTTPDELDSTTKTSCITTGGEVTVINVTGDMTLVNDVTTTNTATAFTMMKQPQKGSTITRVTAKAASQALRASPTPATRLSQNPIPIAAATKAVSLGNIAPVSVAGGGNPTYIIVTNQPSSNQS